MSEKKFTPGPWSIPHFARPDVDCGCGYVLVDGYCGAVATVHFSADRELGHGDNPPMDEAVANANLIAAALEMYEAMTEFVHRCEIGEVRSVKTYAKFKAILAKADGK